jgi:Ca2+-binding EF-hand superfamily protein
MADDEAAHYKRSTPEELAGLRDTFNALDEKRTGRIDKNGLSQLLGELKLPAELASLILFIFDTDHTGTLEIDEFVEYMESMADLARYPRRFFRLLFNAIDTDGSGFLEAPELVEFARILNVELNENDALEAIDEIDLDGNRKMDFDELCTALAI